MNLRKRIYLLTPVLVLCCVLAAGFFIKESAPVDAATIEKVGSYKPTKLKDVIDKEKTMTSDEWAAYNGTDKAAAERFDIKEFDMNLFDYDGREWNAFNAFQYNHAGNTFLAFKNGNTRGFDSYTNNRNNNTPEALLYLWKGVNFGGNSAKQGILENKLFEDGIINFNDGLIDGADGVREHILFDPYFNDSTYNTGNYVSKYNSGQIGDYWIDKNYTFQGHGFKISEIRPRTCQGTFEFIYDKATEYYTYNSAQNHAQFNKSSVTNGIEQGKIELYTDTLAPTNGTVDQTKNIGDVNNNGVYNNGVSDFIAIENRFTFNFYQTDNRGCGYIYQGGEKFDNPAQGFIRHAITSDGAHIQPGFGLTKFTLPTSQNDEDQNLNENIKESIEYNKLEYVYVKFRCFSKTAGINVPTSFRIIFSSSNDKPHSSDVYWYGDDGAVFNIQGDNTGAKYVRYTYNYNLVSSNVSGAYGWQEIKIPVNDVSFNIEQIIICPVFFAHNQNNTGTTFADSTIASDKWNKAIYFDLMEFGLGYNLVGKDNPNGIDKTATSAFMPFENIANSYPSESGISLPSINSKLNSWMSSDALKNSETSYGNRSVANKFHENGLTAIEKNNSDGTENTAAHFGMSLEIDFFIPNDRLTEHDNPIMFEFYGDDDLWIFIDDQLVLDIGGCHTREKGIIDITNSKVTYGSTPILLQNGKYGEPYSQNDQNYGITYASSNVVEYNDTDKPFAVGEHTMKIFYMERESGTSNCYISFNLPQVPEGGLTVSADAKMKDGSDLPEDFNGDGLNDDTIVVKNVNGNIAYFQEGGSTEISNGLVSYEYVAKVSIPVSYYDDEDLFTGTYQLYKTSDPEDTTVSGLKLKIDSKSNSDRTDVECYDCEIRFVVPAGYTATIILPEDTIIDGISEVNPENDKIVGGIAYADTAIDPSLKYVLQKDDPGTTSTNEYTVGTDKKDTVTGLEYNYTNGDFSNNLVGSLKIGGDVQNVVVFKPDFVNYYKLDIVTVKFNKDIILDNAETDLNADNNLNSNEKFDYTNVPSRDSLKNDFEDMVYNFKIQYKNSDGKYVTSALKYIIKDSDGNQVGGDNYTTSSGEFYMKDGYIIEMDLPGGSEQGKVDIKVEELTGNKNLPGNYTYNKTQMSSYYRDDNMFADSKIGDLNSSYPTMELTAIENYRYEFTNMYIWNIDFITEPDDKGVEMDIDEDVRVEFHNKLDEENWLDGEGSADNDFGADTSNHYPPKD